jgi:hypothetical protein
MLAPVATGDLDGDGVDEAIAYAEVQNGDRRLIYLIAFTQNNDGWTQRARVLLGAGVLLSPIRVEEGLVKLTVEEWQEGFPLCCALRAEERRYALETNARDGDTLAVVESDQLSVDGDAVGEIITQTIPALPARITDRVGVNVAHLYTMTIPANTPFTITVESGRLPIEFAVASASEPIQWLSAREEIKQFSGQLSTAQELTIGIRAAESAASYTLDIEMGEKGTSTREWAMPAPSEAVTPEAESNE